MDTAVVICTWNKRDDVLACLASLRDVQGAPFEVVVVDNASEDRTAEAVQEAFPSAHLIVNERNLGGAGGFNTGLRHLLSDTRFRYAWLLDNDVVVDPAALAALRQELKKDASTAVAGSLILRRDAPSAVQELGALIDFDAFEARPRFRDYPVGAMPAEAEDVDYVPACSLLVDLEKVRRVGVMDEQYFLYGDDIDWCIRFKRAGYRVVTAPASRVWHREGGRNRTSNLPVYYSWRNMCHFFAQSVAGTNRVDAFLHVFIRRAFIATALARGAGRSNSARTLLTAIWDAMTGTRGRAAASRNLPLDAPPLPHHRGRFLPTVALLGGDLEFYTAVRPLLDTVADGKVCDFYTSVEERRLPAWLLERTRLRPEAEVEAVPPDATLVVLSRHVVTMPHPRERDYRALMVRKGSNACFFDQHSNLVWGTEAVTALRATVEREWQWFAEWFAPLLEERARALSSAHGIPR